MRQLGERNYGCRIRTDMLYKQYAMVIMENSLFRLVVLPGKGTDIIELLYKPADMDFAWFTHFGLPRKDAGLADFQSRYEGGWQEILPSLSGKHIHQGITLEAYGEVSLAEWDYAIVHDEQDRIAVQFQYKLRTMPLTIAKTIEMHSGKPGFTVAETLRNDSPTTIYADWGHHITFGTPFLKPGVVLELPRPHGRSKMPDRGAPGGFDVIEDLREGAYRLTNHAGIGAQVKWDLHVWPYLWYWRDFGADHSPPSYGRHYNIGLELFSSPPAATLAHNIEAGTAIRLEAGGKYITNMEFSVIDEMVAKGATIN